MTVKCISQTLFFFFVDSLSLTWFSTSIQRNYMPAGDPFIKLVVSKVSSVSFFIFNRYCFHNKVPVSKQQMNHV